MPPSLPPDIGVILVDHGSRRAEANAMLIEVARAFAESSGASIVEPAHMELASPDIAEAFARCVARGAKRVVIHPYFLSPGRHSTTDIPELARAAAMAHPGVSYSVTEPLGLDPRMCEVILRRIHDALGN